METSFKQAGQRDSALDALKWVSILGVIVQHVDFPNRYSPSTLQGIGVIQDMLAWCVLSYFGISGFLTKLNQPLMEYAKSRSCRLLIPYVTASLVSYSILVFINLSGLYLTPDDLAPIRLFHAMFTLRGFGPQFYFLPYLFLIGLSWALLARWLRPLGVLVCVGALLSIQCIVLPPPHVHGAGIDKILLYSTAFSFGAAFQRARVLKRGIVKIAGLAFGLILILIAVNQSKIVILLATPFFLYLSLGRLPFALSSVFSSPTLNTGAVYLWHCPIMLPGFSIALHKVGITEWANVLLACTLAVLGSLAVHSILKRYNIHRFFSL